MHDTTQYVQPRGFGDYFNQTIAKVLTSLDDIALVKINRLSSAELPTAECNSALKFQLGSRLLVLFFTVVSTLFRPLY